MKFYKFIHKKFTCFLKGKDDQVDDYFYQIFKNNMIEISEEEYNEGKVLTRI